MSGTPNILFILSDQQRWDTLGCYGRPIYSGLTPRLDAMAATGTRFANAFTPQPLCGPARACLQTGRYASETANDVNFRRLDPHGPTLAKYLRAAGYFTGYLGKWHLASHYDDLYRFKPVPREFRGGYEDYWLAADGFEHTSTGYHGYLFDEANQRVDFDGYRADAIGDHAVDFIENVAPEDQPWMLFTSFIEPHHQNNLDRFIGPLGSKQRYADFSAPGDLPIGQGDWEQQMPDYLGCCARLDYNVGKMLDALEDRGMAENTVVIYTSDHGCHFKTRNAEYKRSCHDNSTRIPLLISGPGFEGGRTSEELVSLIDLPATLLDVAGIEIPSAFRGDSLSESTAGDREAPLHEGIYIEVTEESRTLAWRTKDWLYGLSLYESQNGVVEGMPEEIYVEAYLYDVNEDPQQQTNLVSDQSLDLVRRELRAQLSVHIRSVAGKAPVTFALGSSEEFCELDAID